MTYFSFEKTSINDVYIINPFYNEDNRGYFIKDYEKDIFKQNGLDINFYESFESFSFKNVLRGLHFQTFEPQAKLVRAITGSIYDVIVDLRANSNTFLKWEGFCLTNNNRKSLYIPKGFAHGFYVLSESAIVSYKCVGKYQQGSDSGIIWNDKDLDINWGINNPIISERDSKLKSLREFINTNESL